MKCGSFWDTIGMKYLGPVSKAFSFLKKGAFLP